ncbi:peptidylprolyl isomerase [Tenacibaculum salmonis]|uniref:peptidylprolyl isomerase n=1 Tax=Tenacibaculum sp. P3-BQ1 TaxID=3232310 RepID=UPI0034DE4622
MKKIFLVFIVLVITSINSFAQKDTELFRINNSPVMVSEFKQVYEKNLGVLIDDKSKDIDNYLELFIDYKLKVKEAYDLKLDTLKNYKNELAGYKNKLIAPYLQNTVYLNELVEQAYLRKKTEVKASHILIKFPKKGIQFDTLPLYNKINAIRKTILNGASFEKIAKEVSEDPSVKVNGGNLGYFSAFSMVYPFEDAAYATDLSKVSKPFKTKFGYHILQVTGKRVAKGDFEVAHILVKDNPKGELKINELYQKIASGISFETVAKKYSEDKGTAFSGGKLLRFGTGKMVAIFENKVRELPEIGAYSKPFKTKYGWHIVKLLKNYPIGSFDDLKDELTDKVKKTNRASLSKTAILNKLKKEYRIKEHKKALAVFLTSDIHQLKEEKLNKVLLSINNKKITQQVFFKSIKYKSNQSITGLYENFKNSQIIKYFKDDLINTEPVYRNTLLEYKEGLLLFELLQQKIWNKASKDTLGLTAFYQDNKLKYQNKPFKDVKGFVINDYQKEIEREWISELRKKNKIKIKKSVLKKFKETYDK